MKDKEELTKDVIPVLAPNETKRLAFLEKDKLRPGKYKFMGLQRIGHPYPEKQQGKDNNVTEDGRLKFWGGTITITEMDLKQCNQTIPSPNNVEPVEEPVETATETEQNEHVNEEKNESTQTSNNNVESVVKEESSPPIDTNPAEGEDDEETK
ncbi:hypothetical protein V7138_06030 [Bacillus sp. JJ1533]|uniref:hypothetical protein n=1 Tax=Bacillus sp. JJ1533 TaxID=3122959 RepID=UPI002FFDDEA9